MKLKKSLAKLNENAIFVKSDVELTLLIQLHLEVCFPPETDFFFISHFAFHFLFPVQGL